MWTSQRTPVLCTHILCSRESFIILFHISCRQFVFISYTWLNRYTVTMWFCVFCILRSAAVTYLMFSNSVFRLVLKYTKIVSLNIINWQIFVTYLLCVLLVRNEVWKCYLDKPNAMCEILLLGSSLCWPLWIWKIHRQNVWSFSRIRHITSSSVPEVHNPLSSTVCNPCRRKARYNALVYKMRRFETEHLISVVRIRLLWRRSVSL